MKLLKWFRRHTQAGVATIEAALLLNMLVLLLAGILEFGRVLDVWVITRNAVREGARLGATGASTAEIQDRALAYLNTSLAGRTDVDLPDLADITVTGAEGTPGTGVTVTLATGVQIITPLIQPFFSTSPVPVSSSLTMKIQ